MSPWGTTRGGDGERGAARGTPPCQVGLRGCPGGWIHLSHHPVVDSWSKHRRQPPWPACAASPGAHNPALELTAQPWSSQPWSSQHSPGAHSRGAQSPCLELTALEPIDHSWSSQPSPGQSGGLSQFVLPQITCRAPSTPSCSGQRHRALPSLHVPHPAHCSEGFLEISPSSAHPKPLTPLFQSHSLEGEESSP